MSTYSFLANRQAAEDLWTPSAARPLLTIVLAIQDKIGRSLRLRGGGYHHALVALEFGEPALNIVG